MYRHDEALINSQAEGLVVPNPIIDIKESEDGELFFTHEIIITTIFLFLQIHLAILYTSLQAK